MRHVTRSVAAPPVRCWERRASTRRMNELSTLVNRFAKARLPLALAAAPIARGGGEISQIVQLDIERRRPRKEQFLLWRGAKTNRVEALGVDRELQQLVLLVDEPRRRFEVEISPYVERPESRIVRKEGRRRWIERWTNARKRHFLCGMDESHLFIAELSRGVSTVRDAHEVLRSPELDALERRAEGPIFRQGEWFFIPISVEEEAVVEAEAKQGVVVRGRGIAQAARLMRGGRPHVADEVLVPARLDPRAPPSKIYVRGRVRHPDHKTVVLLHWHRVLANTERSANADGVYWVD